MAATWYYVQSARREAGKGHARSVCRVCGVQTANIPAMFVTPDVSKFSGWLNADAYCQGFQDSGSG